MAGLISTGIAGFIASAKFTGKQIANKAGKLVPEVIEDFVSGFSGHGWKIWKTIAGFFRFEIDELVVRRTMTVFELLIQKIRAVKGAHAITQGNGKIKSVELSEDEAFYLLTLEENDMSIVEYDFIRCQEFSGGQKFYHVEVASVSEGVIRVPVSEFAGSSIPTPGDEIVQFGNSSHDAAYAGRHSAIYMHADESGQPAIDVMFDIYSKDWTGCVKTRVGGDIPGANGLKGFYCENGMIKGVNSTGRTVYCVYPDGSAMFGDGSAEFNKDTSGHIAGGAISWTRDADTGKYICTMKGVVLTWDNLSDDAKDNLKGEAAVVYELMPNAEIITMYKNGQFYPQHVQCQVKKTIGSVSSFMTAKDISADGLEYGWVRDDSGFIQVTPEDSVTPHNDCFPIVFHLKRGDSYICSQAIVTIKDGEDGLDGNPGADANLLPWVEQWNGYATELGEEYIVTPKMFSGTKSTDGKLTGIAQGKECITIGGVKRTGIFALVEDVIVFSIDAETGDVKTTGDVIAEAIKTTGLNINDQFVVTIDENGSAQVKLVGDITATSGKIGGFYITRYGLSNGGVPDKYIYIEEDGHQGKRLAVIGNRIPASAGFDVASQFEASGNIRENRAIATTAKGSTEKYGIWGGNTNFALDAFGGVHWNMPQGDHWCMPGVLVGVDISASGWGAAHTLNLKWGNGCLLSRSQRDRNNFTFYHDIGHTEYFVTITPYVPDVNNNWWVSIPCVFLKESGLFSIQFKNDGGSDTCPSRFEVLVYGRPSVGA